MILGWMYFLMIILFWRVIRFNNKKKLIILIFVKYFNYIIVYVSIVWKVLFEWLNGIILLGMYYILFVLYNSSLGNKNYNIEMLYVNICVVFSY